MASYYQGVKSVIRHSETLQKYEKLGQYIAEPKLDGVWVSVHTDREGKIEKFISRHGKLKTSKGFNKFIGRHTQLQNTVLVGELLTKKGELHIFDVPKLLGRDISSYDFERRRGILEKLDIFSDGISIVPQFKNDFVKHFKEIISQGGEGLVIKKIGKGTKYTAGTKTKDWMKIKKTLTMDYVIMGYDISSSASYKGLVKAIRIGIYKDDKLIEVGKVGSMKVKDREFFSIKGKNLIGKVIEVGGNEVFPSGAMRHPYFIKMRPDLARHDANLEKVEIKESKEIDWEAIEKLMIDWIEQGKYHWVHALLKDSKDFPKHTRNKIIEVAKNREPAESEEQRYYYQELMNLLDPIGYTQGNINKIKSSSTKLPEKKLKLEWAIGDDRFYEQQFGDHRMMHDNITKMPKRVIRKKKALKRIKEAWSNGTDRRTNNTRLSDPDNATGSYELDDTIKPKKKIKKLKVKGQHTGIEYPPKFYTEDWADGSDTNDATMTHPWDNKKTLVQREKNPLRKKKKKKIIEGWGNGTDANSGKRYKSDEEDDMDEFEKLARDIYYDANAAVYSKRKKKGKKKIKIESFIDELKGLDEEVALHKAKKLYQEIKNILRSVVSKIELVGSASRLHPSVNDLDIVVVPKEDIKTYLTSQSIDATSGAEKQINFTFKGTPVNIWAVPKESFGSAILHFSSGKGIIQIKQKAIALGLKLNRYGLFRGEIKIAGENYDEILKLLGTETKFSKIKILEKVVENCEETERFIKEGQFPRAAENYWRFRQIDPKKFDEGTFRIIKGASGNARVIGKVNDKMKVQSILIAKTKLTEKDINDFLKLVIK